MATGSVIVLSGPSSSGKTTLATALQRRFAADGECWFVYAMDDFFAKVPFDWVTAGKHVGVHADEGVVLEHVDGEFRMRMGPIGRAVLVAWRGAVGSAARAGLNVIADEVTLTEDEWQGWQAELDGLDTHWVRVQIALDVLEARETDRGNRMSGHARAQYEDSYRYSTYDAEVDTGTLDPEAAAAAVLAGWRSADALATRSVEERVEEVCVDVGHRAVAHLPAVAFQHRRRRVGGRHRPRVPDELAREASTPARQSSRIVIRRAHSHVANYVLPHRSPLGLVTV